MFGHSAADQLRQVPLRRQTLGRTHPGPEDPAERPVEPALEAVDEADASRIDYHRQIFEALGFAPEEAKLRAFVLYSCEVAESLLHGQGQRAEHRARQDFLEALMQTPLKPGQPP
jgi:hypothetical protein